MSSQVDARGVAWALFFLVVLLVLYDVLSPDSVIADFFAPGSQRQPQRLDRALQRVIER